MLSHSRCATPILVFGYSTLGYYTRGTQKEETTEAVIQLHKYKEAF